MEVKLTEEQLDSNYNKFLELLKTNIKREGIERLIKWLENKDTKTAPASTKYHCSYEGGLIVHSLNVYNRLKKLIELEYGDKSPYSEETITLVALLHDISKIDFYEVQLRNVKENGAWVQKPFYAVKEEKDRLIFGSHSMNSFYMASKFFKLNYEEELAILHHMGGMDSTEDSLVIKNIAEAYKKSTLALLIQQADMAATFIDER